MKQGRQSIVWKILKNLDIVLAGLILGILVVVTFSGVIMRYIFNAPFVWQQEVQLTCFLWSGIFDGESCGCGYICGFVS